MPTIPIAKKPLEVIYIHGISFDTQDGEVMAFFPFDEYSEFAFDPVFKEYPVNDEVFFSSIQEAINNAFKKFDPKIHSSKSSLVTNLPQEVIPTVLEMTNNKFEILHDPKRTEKLATPFLKAFSNSKK
jgi:hypothetical protein